MKPFINKIDKIPGVLSFDALSERVAKYSINAILTDSDRKTLWIDGYPYGYGFYKKNIDSSIVPTGDGKQTYWNSVVLNDYGTDIRYGNIAIGNYSLSSGSLTRAIGNYSVAEGYETWAVGDHSHAEGILSIALAASSHAEGYSNTGEFAVLSHAENISKALGQISHAEGYLSTANGDISHAEGEYTIAYAWGSHAEGYGTKTGNVPNDTHSIPDITSPIKDYLSSSSTTFALHNGITVTFNYIAFTDDDNQTEDEENQTVSSTIYELSGEDAVIDNVAIPTIGFNTPSAVLNPIDTYPGYYSHAEGVTTTAVAMGSHTEGFGSKTEVTALFSHAEGIETITNNYGEHAEGKYNISIATNNAATAHVFGTIHTIGIGSEQQRKNAVRVDNDGAVYLAAVRKNADEYYNPCGYEGTETTPSENEISIQKILATSHIKWVSTTYDEIKTLIETKSLIPGVFYRITDYNTIVNSSEYEQNYISSEMNPFDVIVLAISETELSETAWAVPVNEANDIGLGDDVVITKDPDTNTETITYKTGFIDIYPNRVFTPKYYYYNETIDGNVAFTPTNSKITYFCNDYTTVDNKFSYPALSTIENAALNDIYTLESKSLIDNKNTITWKSAIEVEIDSYDYFNEFKITYESSLLKSGVTLDNISCQRIITYQLDKTETINGQQYYRYQGMTEQAIIKSSNNAIIIESTENNKTLLQNNYKPSDFFIFDYVPYDYVYCKNYKFFDELNNSLNISVTAPTTEPGKPPIIPSNPLFIKNTSGESIAMTELYWEYTSSGIGKHCNNITLSYDASVLGNDILEASITDYIYFDTTDQVSVRKIEETTENTTIVKYVIISKQYSLSYFNDCKLNSWELKYCFSNDTDRFDWADSEKGKGVIYYMKDEWGNECPYDFKNIKFNNKFTFSGGDSTDMSLYGLASQNIIKPYLFTNIKYRLNDITFRTNGSVIGNVFGPNCYNCHFDDTISTTDTGYLFNEFKGGNNGITDEDVNI